MCVLFFEWYGDHRDLHLLTPSCPTRRSSDLPAAGESNPSARPVKLTAFTRYGPRAASTRQRFLQYFPALRAAGIDVEHHALLGDDYVAGLDRKSTRLNSSH